MDFEWQTHAPTDATSPFHKFAMEHGNKHLKSMVISLAALFGLKLTEFTGQDRIAPLSLLKNHLFQA